MKHRREDFRLGEITVVTDRGMVSQMTLEAFVRKAPPRVGSIVGVRMNQQKEVNASVLGSRACWFESVPKHSNAKDPAPLAPTLRKQSGAAGVTILRPLRDLSDSLWIRQDAKQRKVSL